MDEYTEADYRSRKKTLQLLLSNHDKKCLSCVRSGNCELTDSSAGNMAWMMRITMHGESNHYELDDPVQRI